MPATDTRFEPIVTALAAAVLAACAAPPRTSLNAENSPVAVPSGCQPSDFTRSTTLIVEPRGVRIEGHVRIDGITLPSAPLEFTQHDSGAIAHVHTTESSSFAVTLPPGHYAVTRFRNDFSRALVASDVDLTTSRALELDVHTVALRGVVRFDGQIPLPDGTAVRPLVLEAVGGGTQSLVVQPDGTFNTRVVPDTYRARLDPISCGLGDPCNGGSVDEPIVIGTDTTRFFDVSTVQFDAEVGSGIRGGEIRLYEPGSPVLAASFPIDGPHVVRRVIPGVFDVRFVGRTICCDATIALANEVRLDRDTSIRVGSASGHLDVALTMNGTLFPAVSSRGSVQFVSRDGSSTALDDHTVLTASIAGGGGEVRLGVDLPPGHYDVFYRSGEDALPTGILPSAAALLASDVVIDEGGSRSVALDLRTVDLQLVLTQLRQALSIDPTREVLGTLMIAPAGNRYRAQRVSLPVATDGSITTRLGAGRYDLTFAAPPGGNCPNVGCGRVSIAEDLDLANDTTLEFDIPRTVVHVALGPGGLQADTLPRLQFIGPEFDDVFTVPSPAATSEDVNMVGGAYYVVATAPLDCSSDLPATVLCAPQIVSCR